MTTETDQSKSIYVMATVFDTVQHFAIILIIIIIIAKFCLIVLDLFFITLDLSLAQAIQIRILIRRHETNQNNDIDKIKTEI